MTTANNKDLVKQFYDALATSDVDAFLAIQHDDVAYNVHGRTPVSGCFTGKAFVVETVMPQVFDNLQMETFNFSKKWKIMCADENSVVAFMEADGLAKNGERYNQFYCHLFEFRAYKIAAVWEFFDSVLAQRALFNNPLTKDEPNPVSPFDF